MKAGIPLTKPAAAMMAAVIVRLATMNEDQSSGHWTKPEKPPDAESGLWRMAWLVVGVMFFVIMTRGCELFL